MVLPGHLAGGYLVTLGLLTLLNPNLSSEQINILLILGTVAGEIPDIDLIFFNIKHRFDKRNPTTGHFNNGNAESHRNYLTHVPFFWIIICALIILIGTIFDSLFCEYFGLIILSGSLCHLILDSIEYGIRWLAPWSQKRFALKRNVPDEDHNDKPGSLMQYFHYIIKSYWKTATIWCEISISIIAVIVFLKIF